MRLVMPALFIRLPAKMKNGTASSGKLSMPLIIRCTTTNDGMFPVSRTYTSADPAIAIATGTPVAIIARKDVSSAEVIARSFGDRLGELGTLEHAVAAAP